MPQLQFQPLSSQPTPTFWQALNTLKLDKLKLDDTQQPISGWYMEGREIRDREATSDQGRNVGVDGNVVLGGSAFGEGNDSPPVLSVPIKGVFKNFNTIEEFRSTETKKELFNQVIDSILESFKTSTPIFNPFLLVTFADLKKYTYHYWFAFPALISKPGWEIDQPGLVGYDDEQVRALEAGASGNGLRPDGFLIRGSLEKDYSGEYPDLKIGDLADVIELFKDTPEEERSIAFHDHSSLPQNPGWPLRNILFYLQQNGINSINVICLRGKGGSVRGRVRVLPNADQLESGGSGGTVSGGRPGAVGWEKNKVGKLGSRVADLGPMMDPARLADQAVDLNLKLMRWRIMPALDLEKIASTKCLLLGAGTLGCYVARALMGWGIRNITFVDSAKVSYSNPVRQPLFDFEDCLDGGKPKAQCAADRLKKIFPGVNATAHSFTIPMPGHPIPPTSEAQTQTDVQTLETLIRSHDAIFLLMDSRESRWLPTVIGAAEGKIVINAALGFDSYLVMRHGAPPCDTSETGRRLGCYYCNDIVAPADSLTDRTLDQMCTVTRPGIAPIASATAVELLVSLIQHPKGIHAPADVAPGTGSKEAVPSEEPGSPLGLVPHQLRGMLGQWRTMLIEGAAYDRCTGCSKTIIDAYKSQGWPLLLRAFNETDFLEKLTGLDKLYEEGEAALEDVDWEEGSDDGGL